MVARGHEFTVYCWKNLVKDRTAEYQGIRRIFLPTIESKFFGQLMHGFLSGVHSVFCDYDVVHFQCLTNTFNAVIPHILRRNIIINVDGQEWDNPKWPRTARHLYFKSAVYATLAMSREFITDAKGMYDIYLERYGRKSTVIEYGAEVVSPRDSRLILPFGLSPKGYFFIAARLVPSNQIDKIIRAFKLSGSNKILAIAGGGGFKSDFYVQLKKETPENVRFLGMISDQAVMDELYANAYGYLHGASLGGINSALLRPLGAGCPAIAFSTPFNREALEMSDGEFCGILWRNEAELVESIRLLEADEQLAARLSNLSVVQVRQKFSWDLVADQYEVFYKGILEKWSADEIRRQVSAQKEKYANS